MIKLKSRQSLSVSLLCLLFFYFLYLSFTFVLVLFFLLFFFPVPSSSLYSFTTTPSLTSPSLLFSTHPYHLSLLSSHGIHPASSSFLTFSSFIVTSVLPSVTSSFFSPTLFFPSNAFYPFLSFSFLHTHISSALRPLSKKTEQNGKSTTLLKKKFTSLWKKRKNHPFSPLPPTPFYSAPLRPTPSLRRA